jgi:hypothetical protein
MLNTNQPAEAAIKQNLPADVQRAIAEPDP